MNLIGKTLLWAGFLSGALAAVYELDGSKNQALTIPWFALSITGAAIGIGLIWVSRKVEAGDASKSQGSIETLTASIAHLVAQALELDKSQDKLAPSEIVHWIDEKCATDFQNFAESRKSLIPVHGLSTYAEVMTQFAAGERAMNRAWSAAADGYVDEVRECLKKSREHLEETQKILLSLQTDLSPAGQ